MSINIGSQLRHPVSRNLYKLAAPLIERDLAIRKFNSLCDRTRQAYLANEQGPSAHAWFDAALKEIGATYDAQCPDQFQLPDGPLLVLSNHPF